VSSARNFHAARGEGTQFAICARALQNERRLGLVELACNPPHLLVAQLVRVLDYSKRVARQWRIGKNIDQSCNQFGHSPPASLSIKAQRELR